MENNSPSEIWKELSKAKNVLLSLHLGPDGDSLGSCLAMKYVLEREFGSNVKLVSKESLSESLSSFGFAKEVEEGRGIADFYEEELSKFDVILFLDCGSLSYFLGDSPKEFLKNYKLVNIDHHETNSYFGNLNYVDKTRPSACSVLLDLFREVGVKFDSELATKLLLGIYTDSGGFSHDDGGAIKDASFLIDCGADYLDGIVNVIRYNTPLKIKQYFALAVECFKIVEVEGVKVGVSLIPLDKIESLNLDLSEVRGAPNYLQEIGGIDLLFVITEMKDVLKGSFRSRKKVDTSLFATELGGGGHKFACAFKLPKMPLEEAEKKVLDVIKKVGIHRV